MALNKPKSSDNIKSANLSLVWLLALGVAISFVSVLIVERNFVFDDSFISYRYAKNMAQGYGITWNRGEMPVEGYSNFLLVVILSPFIALGMDPLLVTRILSVLSAIGIAFFCGRFAFKLFSGDRLVSVIIGLAFLPLSNTFYHSTVGLETVIFTFVLFYSFYCAVLFLDGFSLKYLILFNLSLFCSFLLRPEGILLGGAFILLIVVRSHLRVNRVHIMVASIGFFIFPLSCYLCWKKIHFGTIIPNPFFLKGNIDSIVSLSGLWSIKRYFILNENLFLLAILAIPIAIGKSHWNHRFLSFTFIIMYLIFFSRIDTLMDIYERFIYPITPFILVLAMPVIALMFGHLLKWKYAVVVKFPVIVIVFFLLFYGAPYKNSHVKTIWKAMYGVDEHIDRNQLMQKEYIVAKKLSQFADIREVSIATGDAGMIPYFTESNIIDLAGLNDRFIAREKDLGNLTDYLFLKCPTLIIFPSNKDFTLMTDGHGPLGDFTMWSKDPRWLDYLYTGTVRTDCYDLHFLLRKDYAGFDRFDLFIKKNVAESVYAKFPLLLGMAEQKESKSIKSMTPLINAMTP